MIRSLLRVRLGRWMVDTQHNRPLPHNENSLRPVSAHGALDSRELELLLLIAGTPGALGARELGRKLNGPTRVSESTLNRLLRRLDEQGLTVSQDGRGRVLSAAGRALAERAANEQRWHEQLGALGIHTLEDVHDLVIARRGLEREIARSVATTASQEDIERLRGYLAEYDRSIETDSARRDVAVDFHKALVSLSSNRMLQAAAMVLFDTRFDVFEQVLDIATAGRGRTHEGPHEHDAIVEAIVRGDIDGAEAAMVRHLDRLVDDASSSVAPSTLLAIELFLQDYPSNANIPLNL